ncbi:ATP-dependent DNA helicase srs2 [Aspergillus lentulus]|uniref:DNA 3'-5' helicase n=1 Tax=Aspergillus lentulus TaxID=293939 RepID=A0AAN4PJC1_ASPLE|nr:ATP-dependent DNA helicase srs2 [Aspergillus lentulus]
MDSTLEGLNTAQKAAVTSPASILQVLAPPGSGKTKTLTARVAYLLSHYGYQPQDVICCTFTIKASREMRERLAKLVGDEVQSKLILGTFHSICRRYLVSYGYLIGLRRGFGIADSSDSLAIIKRIVKRLRCSIQPNTARARISHQKAHGVSPDEAAVKYSRGLKSAEHHEFVQIYREYEIYLATSNLLDYDDLLLRCADLLRRHPQCVSNVQAVLVDEFQDTNHIQYELMNLFAVRNRRITVVGDPDQSIYGFRSAEIKNLGRMQQHYKDTSVILLEDNYRSSGSILRSAQDVIEQDSSRPAKKLQPTHRPGTMPVLRKLPTAEAEAQWIVLEIKRSIAMTGKLLNYSDFAILLRSAALSRHIESEMGKQGVPYKMVGGLRFFDRVEIKVLLDYLRVISNPGNSDALLRIINVPSRKIGEESVKTLMNGADAAKIPLWNFIKDVAQGRRSTDKNLAKLTDQGLCTLVGIIESSRQKLLECTDGSAPRKLLEFVIKKLNFREYLTATYCQNEENRWANVEELLAQAGDVAATETENDQDDSLPEIQGLAQQQAHKGEEALSQFLANVALSTEVLSEDGDQPQEKVTISTIHAAKGLEWPVVFVPAVYNGIIPHSRAEDSDEERRLLYVAMTRAQALLYLSYPLRQSRNEEATTTVTSFLPPKLIENRFRPLGPNLQEKVVYGIADILRRPRPSSESMLVAYDSIPSLRDDQWTADGKEAPDAIVKWDGSRAWGEEPDPKRRRYNPNPSFSSTTTYLSSSTYTVNHPQLSMSTNMSLGFSSARDYISTTSASQAAQSSGPKVDCRSNRNSTGPAGRNATGLSHENISRFFGKSSTQAKDPCLPAPMASSQPQIGAKGLLGQANHVPLSNPAFKSVIPTQLSCHRPQTQRIQPPRPVLEPSGSNEYNWLAAASRPIEKRTLQNGEENQGPPNMKETLIAESGTGENKKPSGAVGGVRPVATFHTTTMTMVQKAGPTGRRTLGIRRTVNDGWADRWKKAGNGQSR